MKLIVNKKQRLAKARAHTGVHLLYGALEKVTNRKDIRQAGSYVDEDYGRLDFNSDKPLTYEQLKEIERLVNNWIYDSINVEILETSLEEAIKMGAKAFFEEKYGEKVRVVKVDNIDIQLCGGTHVKNTSEIGAFKIISQEAIASGIKRISIITGPKVAYHLIEKIDYLNKISQKIDSSSPAQIIQKIEKILKELENYKQENQQLKESIIISKLKSIPKLNQNEIDYIINADDFDQVNFKTLVQKTREILKGKIIILSKKQGNFAIVSNDPNFSAKEFAQKHQLKGGGNDNIFQGKDERILKLI